MKDGRQSSTRVNSTAKSGSTPPGGVSIHRPTLADTGVGFLKELVLQLPYPPTVNTLKSIVNGRMVLSKKGREYREAVADCCIPWVNSCSGDDGHLSICGGQCATMVAPQVPMAGPLCVEIRVARPDKRRRDLDNILKAVLDGLGQAGVYEDDSQIQRLEVQWDRAGVPGVRVGIRSWAE